MTGAHPLLHIHNVRDFTRRCFHLFSGLFISLWLGRAFKIASEMLKEGHLLLQSRWIVCDVILLADILTVSLAALNIIKVVAVWV